MGAAHYKNLIIIFIGLVLFSCKKEVTKTPPTISQGDRKVFIVCEGSYGNGNGALGLYLPKSDTSYENIYQSINKMSLGDVFQSVQKIGNQYLLCINNSDRVIAVDTALKFSAYLNVPKPRYILPVSATKAYISSLFHNKMMVINPVSMTVTDSIIFPKANTEGMLLYNNYAYVCNWDPSVNKIYRVNTTSNKIDDSINISGYAPQEVLLDKEEKIWVLSGNVQKGKSASWTHIDPATKQIIKSYSFPSNADPLRPVMNASKDTIYFIEVNYNGGTDNNGVYRMSIYSSDLPQQPFIPAQQFQYFWGLAIDPVNGDIYVGDPKGFIQKGSVSIYTSNGNLRRTFSTGVAPGHFYFSD